MAKQEKHILFDALKQAVENCFNQNTGSNSRIAEWTVNDINRFRDDMEIKVRSRVSEKWVYLHFKRANEKMPRIDVLNLLSQYAGYESWDGFVAGNRHLLLLGKKRHSHLAMRIALLTIVLVATGMVILYSGKQSQTVYLRMVDSYTNKPVKITRQEMYLSSGKLDSVTEAGYRLYFEDSVRLTIRPSSYYKPAEMMVKHLGKDTIDLPMQPDDIAFMLHYFANTEPNLWQQKAIQLDTMFHDNAKIYHYHPDLNGIELLNKQEFILRISVPNQLLKAMKILDIRYINGKIHQLRFQIE